MPPEKLGAYRIGDLLGRGGMGAVYEGFDEEKKRPVAVKVLSSIIGEDDALRPRFAAEIATLTKLKHPNIVELYGYGEQDGQLFYGMELVEGVNLNDELKNGRRFTWQEVVRIGIDICRALRHAHDYGIVHRDLKPANLLLLPDNQTKLTDFGIAKIFGGSQMTVAGGIVGTPDYMAPEQAEGQPATTRSDLFSLGAVLYTLAARRPPFVGPSVVNVLQKVRFEEPQPLAELAPEMPEQLIKLIARLMNKDPQARIATAQAVANRLEEIAEAAAEPESNLDGLTARFSDDDDFTVMADDPASAKTDIFPESHAADGTALRMDADDAREPGVTRERTQGELAAASQGKTVSDAAESNAVDAPANFTHVEQEHRPLEQDISVAAEDRLQSWIKGGLLAIAVVAVGAVIWYMTRPPSADALYQRIRAAAESGEKELVGMEQETADFLQRFPQDSRADEVADYQADVELYRLQRRFELRARLRRGQDRLSPVERAYLKASALVQSDPQSAADKLQALIDVYGGQPGASKSTQQCVELARKKLATLRGQLRMQSNEDRAAVEKRLEFAEQIRDSDPAGAEAIYDGIMELYGDKPWAADLMERAKDQLGGP